MAKIRSAEGRGRVVVARGVRATEALLLAEIARLAGGARDDLRLLAQPVRIVVPSRSLREHVAARIVAEASSSVGVSVHTLRGLAFEILRRAGEGAPGGDALFPVVVRAEARRHGALRAALDELRDGYGVVAASVADLLDAGFEAHHAEAVLDALAAAGGTELARALVEVAAATLGALRAHGLEHRSGFFRRAREALERDPEARLPARAVFVHGFADATGVQLDLLEALVRQRGASVLVDHPEEPGAAGTPSVGVPFTGRLLGRLGGVAPVEIAAGEPPPPAAPELLRAPGAQAEVRAVGERIHALLAEGVPPERIGVVARELGPYLFALRAQLQRLGIPFSGAPGRLGFLGPEGRRVRALLDLLRERDRLAVDRWLDAQAPLPQEGEGAVRRARRADLRMGLHALGAGRLRAVADLDVGAALGGRDALPLPVRRGFSALESDDADADPGADAPRESRLVARRRELAGALLAGAVERARAVLRELGRWPEETPLADHVSRLGALLDALGWSGSASGALAARELSAALASDLGGALRLGEEDFVLLTARTLGDVGVDALGGAGGGVRVLSVIEARAQGFEHLFVLGLNRDLFPRRATEDPLLPDALRRGISAALPDLPIKARGFDEERYLFAQLCSAAPRVTLSWQSVSDDGKEKTASPLVERLLRDGGGVHAAPPLFAEPRASGSAAARGGGAGAPRPAFEHAVLAGLYGRRGHFEASLGEALREAWRELDGANPETDAAALARVRVAILDEFEGRGRSREVGPYFGFVGRLGTGPDPRHDSLYVTTLENLARCPWRTFLERVLRLEAVPDALEELPGPGRLLMGNLLHGVLERIVRQAGAASGVELGALDPKAAIDVAWPEPARLDAILLEAAREVLREEGIVLRGFERLLVPALRPLLDRVRGLEWGDAAVLRGVLGAEVTGEVELRDERGAPLAVRFRADRVDLRGGRIELTDYKSGKDPSGLTTPPKDAGARWEKYLDGLAKGTWLQAAGYALARREDVAAGRYLFAKETIPPEAAELRVRRDDAGVRETFERAVAPVLGAWRAGSFVPRLVDGDGRAEPRQCEWCSVSDACLRGESGARHRLLRFVEGARAAPEERSELERALLEVFELAGGRP